MSGQLTTPLLIALAACAGAVSSSNDVTAPRSDTSPFADPTLRDDPSTAQERDERDALRHGANSIERHAGLWGVPPRYTFGPSAMSTTPRDIQVWLLTADGSRIPFLATGVRIPLSDGVWVGVDLHPHPQSLSVVAHVRNRRPGAEPMPAMAIVPYAGGAAMVQIGRTGPTAFEVTPVDRAELTGDIPRMAGENDFR